jgi:hypothetical protein
MQAEAPTPAPVFAGQAVHALAPAALYVLAGHGRQAVLFMNEPSLQIGALMTMNPSPELNPAEYDAGAVPNFTVSQAVHRVAANEAPLIS